MEPAPAETDLLVGLELVVQQGVSVVGGPEMLELALRRVRGPTRVPADHIVLLLPGDVVPGPNLVGGRVLLALPNHVHLINEFIYN